MATNEPRRCPRCSSEMPSQPGQSRRGRPPVWCSQRCRRAAYEERRAASNGAVAVRVETVEKPVEKIIVRVRTEIQTVPVNPADAAEIVKSSPRACRAVLEFLAAEADAGRLSSGAHQPILRAASELLNSLRNGQLITDRKAWNGSLQPAPSRRI